MPYTENEGARIYWDEVGEGPDLLLIHGLAHPSQMWYRLRPALAEHYRTIALDNRGSGRSDVTPGPYSMALMARDALAVLEAAGSGRAHVFGISMGGMIAQEFAFRYPNHLQSLILACTTPGGPQTVKSEPEVGKMFFSYGELSAEQYARAGTAYVYDPGTSRERIDEDLAIRRPWWASPGAYWAQLEAILSWEGYSRLPEITAPTLVIHGASDRLVVPANARTIAERIPGAELVIMPNASHNFPTDQPEAAKSIVLDFLSRQTQTAEKTASG